MAVLYTNTFRQFKSFLPRYIMSVFIILNKTDQFVYSNEHYKMTLGVCQVPILVWCKSGVNTVKIRRQEHEKVLKVLWFLYLAALPVPLNTLQPISPGKVIVFSKIGCF